MPCSKPLAGHRAIAGSIGSEHQVELTLGDDAIRLAKKLRTAIESGVKPVNQGPLAIEFTPDGRQCHCCKRRDDSKDHVTDGFLAWWYPPKDGKSCGMICWYCGKAWFVKYRFSVSTRTTTLLVKELGTCDEFRAEFFKVRDFIVEKAIENGGKFRSVNKDELKTRIYSIHRKGSEVYGEEDWVEIEWYKTGYKHYDGTKGLGDPLTNGLGHKIARHEGPPIKKIRKGEATFVDVHKEEDDGTCVVGDKHFEDNAMNIAACLGAGFDFFGLGNAGGAEAAPKAKAGGESNAEVTPMKDSKVQSASLGLGLGMELVCPQLPGETSSTPATDNKSRGGSGGAESAAPKAKDGGAKAAPKAKAESQGGRGRKKRNLIFETTRTAKEFAACSQDDRAYFGVGSKAMLAWMKRLMADFEDRFQTIQDEEDPFGIEALAL